MSDSEESCGPIFEADASPPAVRRAFEQTTCVLIRGVVSELPFARLDQDLRLMVGAVRASTPHAGTARHLGMTEGQYEALCARGAINGFMFSRFLYGDDAKLALELASIVAESRVLPLIEALFDDAVTLHDFLNFRFRDPADPGSALPMHQDGTGMDYGWEGRPPVDRGPWMLSMFTPFVSCGIDRPALELIPLPVTSFYDLAGAPETRFGHLEISDARIDRELPGARWHPPLEPGDVLLFAERTLHRSYLAPGMSSARTSVDLRFLPRSRRAQGFGGAPVIDLPELTRRAF